MGQEVCLSVVIAGALGPEPISRDRDRSSGKPARLVIELRLEVAARDKLLEHLAKHLVDFIRQQSTPGIALSVIENRPGCRRADRAPAC